MKIISVILMLMGLYLIINSDSESEKPRQQKIQYKEKRKDLKIERLVEIIDPEYDIKHPKSN